MKHDLNQVRSELGEVRKKMEGVGKDWTPNITVVAPKQRKIRKFHGEASVDRDYSVEDFIEEVSWVIEQEGGDSMRTVMTNVEGQAKRELRACARHCSSVEDYYQVLRDAFGDHRTLPQLLEDFAGRKQMHREGVREYANDMAEKFHSLVAKQKRDKVAVSGEEMLIEHFCEGLRDRALVLDLKRQLRAGIKGFHKIRKLALEWEEIKFPNKGVRPNATVETVKDEQSVVLENLQKSNMQMAAQLQELTNKLESLSKKGESLSRESQQGFEQTAHTGERTDQSARLAAGSRTPQRGGRGGHRFDFQFTHDGRPICVKCGQAGHIQRNCRGVVDRSQLNGNPLR
jgi:hypothetical protein